MIDAPAQAVADRRPLVTRSPARLGRVVWRAIDVTLAAAILLLAAPLLAVLAVAVRLDSPGPVLFRQRRLGEDMRPFAMAKFRTMRAGASSDPHRAYVTSLIAGNAEATHGSGEPIFKLSSDDRVTRVGRVLRRWSLDELPQLWNVLRGEMSLVGPRPAISYEVELYEPHWYRRFAVKPGITGLWQVSGRSRLGFRDMLELDVQYAERWSVPLNLRILVKTAWVVVRPREAA